MGGVFCLGKEKEEESDNIKEIKMNDLKLNENFTHSQRNTLIECCLQSISGHHIKSYQGICFSRQPCKVMRRVIDVQNEKSRYFGQCYYYDINFKPNDHEKYFNAMQGP